MRGLRTAWLLSVLVLLLVPAVATGQEREAGRRLGLTIAYASGSATTVASTGTIGLIWETSEQWAFRPEFQLAMSSRSEQPASLSYTTWGAGATLTVLRYVARKENARAYVAPRVGYSRSWGTGAARTMGINTGLAAGLQYDLARRIGLYGEAGLVYTYAKSTYATQYGTRAHAIGARSALGVNLYF